MTDDKIKKQAREINMLYKVNEEQETEINRLKMIIDIKDDAYSAIIKDNLELKKEIERLTELIDIRDDAGIDLVEEIKELQSELTDSKNDLLSCLKIADNDYKKCYAENIRLAEENNNLRRNIKNLCDENVSLRHKLYEVINNDNNY